MAACFVASLAEDGVIAGRGGRGMDEMWMQVKKERS